MGTILSLAERLSYLPVTTRSGSDLLVTPLAVKESRVDAEGEPGICMPSATLTLLASQPLAIRRDAKVWRRSWKLGAGSLRPADTTALLSDRSTLLHPRGLPVEVVKM